MTEKPDLAALAATFADTRVLCLGDVMLDRFVVGEVERVSPEAPIPVLRVTERREMLGGAGNVARNLTALGAKADLLGVLGADATAEAVRRCLAAEAGIEAMLAVDDSRPTTLKTRYAAAGQQLLRADDETARPLDDATRASLIEAATARLDECGALVLSDYGKGVLSPALLTAVLAAAKQAGCPVVIDPKGRDYAGYRGARVVTPNRRELAEATSMPVDDLDLVAAAAAALVAEAGLEAVLVTLGADGMLLVDGDGDAEPRHLPARRRDVFDVSGAGDTVVATLAAGLAAGLELGTAAELANLGGGVVVGKAGTAVLYADDLIGAVHAADRRAGEAKIVTRAGASEAAAGWRTRGLKIGFTNGCFELLHPGHVSLLRQARAACDRLIVGLNSDASVRGLKGEARPVQNEAARAAVLASLADVDLVVIFTEDTPLELLEALRPDLLVKGADYSREDVVGGDLVEGYGGRVLLADLEDGHSTSQTIRRMAP